MPCASRIQNVILKLSFVQVDVKLISVGYKYALLNLRCGCDTIYTFSVLTASILHGMARFLALYQGEYSRERLILRLRTVHPKTITRLAQNDTGNVAACHMKQILSIYNGAGRTHNLPCKR